MTIPLEVKLEVVDRGKDEGMADAFLIETEIENGWITVNPENDNKVKEIAESAGIDIGEASEIMLARIKKCPVLIDDLAARRFAADLGLSVVGSIGVLIKSERTHKISNIDVYEDARKIIEEMRC